MERDHRLLTSMMLDDRLAIRDRELSKHHNAVVVEKQLRESHAKALDAYTETVAALLFNLPKEQPTMPHQQHQQQQTSSTDSKRASMSLIVDDDDSDALNNAFEISMDTT